MKFPPSSSASWVVQGQVREWLLPADSHLRNMKHPPAVLVHHMQYDTVRQPKDASLSLCYIAVRFTCVLISASTSPFLLHKRLPKTNAALFTDANFDGRYSILDTLFEGWDLLLRGQTLTRCTDQARYPHPHRPGGLRTMGPLPCTARSCIMLRGQQRGRLTHGKPRRRCMQTRTGNEISFAYILCTVLTKFICARRKIAVSRKAMRTRTVFHIIYEQSRW
jgi:hypothetical protein